jgi:hypothetical protein
MTNSINIEEEIIILSAGTIHKLFSFDNGSDVVSLYLFYHKQCKFQGTNQSFTVADFAKKGLKWGDVKYRNAKKILKQLWLVEDVCEKWDDGKINGWFVKLNYIKTTTTQNHSLVSSTGGFQETNAWSSKTENAWSSKTQSAYEFDSFYRLYPKKEARESAVKAFNKLSEDEKALAISEAAKHATLWHAKRTERRFIPLPASWLNAKRFLDVLDQVWPTEQERFDYMDTGSMKAKFDIIEKYRPEFFELRKKPEYTDEDKIRGKEIQTEFEATFNLK